ncbi:hypothetical protein EN875_034005 [Mesorhizobium sp. M2D.F.Ca.ET.232.01.1.1]|uniref:hypothetical protein n=1 Tax=Mesorhizobium sp. M2D.F.Ca.ET.232.01.1.1 TaxID=2496670 RepID=UPI000FCB24FA|nr:hypothetical protein [Mesorhizobium sp. M2D.F.Ca.ET.232.01.1.1]TGP27356.1 hypothetical protein EN875_034005 [Mesorhizobium sp. M2D.F.Ca.ET.232.01.1.1]
MLADSAQIDLGSEPAAPSKGGGKTRLLTLDSLDRRTRGYQMAAEFRDELIRERGGEANLDAMRLRFIEDFAVTSAMIQDAQVRWLAGDPVDPGIIATLLNTRRRDAEMIGGPQPRDVTPTSLRDRLLQGNAA